MSEGSQVSSFQPTEAWHADWPYGVATSVQVQACVAGPTAARAVQEFLKPLNQDPDADVPEGANLYYWVDSRPKSLRRSRTGCGGSLWHRQERMGLIPCRMVPMLSWQRLNPHPARSG